MSRSRLKVLHISSENTWRGGERQMSLLMAGLHQRGVECHLACQEGSPMAEKPAEGWQKIPLHLGPLGWLASLWRLRRYCIDNGIQICDAHSSRGHSFAIQLARLVPDLQVVVHRRVDNRPKTRALTRSKYHNPRVRRYVAISQAIADVLLDYGVPASQVSVVHSAVPPMPEMPTKATLKHQLCQRLGWDEAIPIIGNIAYLTEQKGHDTLIRALSQLKQRGLRFQAYIAGDGTLRDQLTQLAEACGLDELVFLGIEKQPLPLLKASDLFAMPSNNEGLGTAILDALTCGVPVAATSVGGIPEIIQHEVTGMLSPVGDATLLADNLVKLLQSADNNGSLITAGREIVSQRFSVDAMVEGNLAIYKQLLSI